MSFFPGSNFPGSNFPRSNFQGTNSKRAMSLFHAFNLRNGAIGQRRDGAPQAAGLRDKTPWFGLGKITGLMKYWSARAAVRQLAAKDDRILRDIGLVRSDIDRALLCPLDRDPTHLLRSARRAGQRRGDAS